MLNQWYCVNCGCTLDGVEGACPSCDRRCTNCDQPKCAHLYVNDGVGLICPTALYRGRAESERHPVATKDPAPR
jgi:hypothetical protein